MDDSDTSDSSSSSSKSTTGENQSASSKSSNTAESSTNSHHDQSTSSENSDHESSSNTNSSSSEASASDNNTDSNTSSDNDEHSTSDTRNKEDESDAEKNVEIKSNSITNNGIKLEANEGENACGVEKQDECTDEEKNRDLNSNNTGSQQTELKINEEKDYNLHSSEKDDYGQERLEVYASQEPKTEETDQNSDTNASNKSKDDEAEKSEDIQNIEEKNQIVEKNDEVNSVNGENLANESDSSEAQKSSSRKNSENESLPIDNSTEELKVNDETVLAKNTETNDQFPIINNATIVNAKETEEEKSKSYQFVENTEENDNIKNEDTTSDAEPSSNSDTDEKSSDEDSSENSVSESETNSESSKTSSYSAKEAQKRVTFAASPSSNQIPILTSYETLPPMEIPEDCFNDEEESASELSYQDLMGAIGALSDEAQALFNTKNINTNMPRKVTVFLGDEASWFNKEEKIMPTPRDKRSEFRKKKISSIEPRANRMDSLKIEEKDKPSLLRRMTLTVIKPLLTIEKKEEEENSETRLMKALESLTKLEDEKNPDRITIINVPSKPIWTIGSCCIMILCLMCEGLYGGFTSMTENPFYGPNKFVLLQMGAKHYGMIADGEIWRLFTAMFLQNGLISTIITIMYIIYSWNLERDQGFWKALFFFIVSGSFSFMVACLFTPNSISCGSTGALAGYIGVLLNEILWCWKESENKIRNISIHIGSFVIMLIIGITPFIDNFCHIGGIVIGILISLMFLPNLDYGHIGGIVYQVCTFFSFPVAITLYMVCLVMVYRFNLENPFCKNCQYFNCAKVHNWCDTTL